MVGPPRRSRRCQMSHPTQRSHPPPNSSPFSHFLPTASLQGLVDLLLGQGYRVVGPRVRDGAVIWESIQRIDDLPRGWREVQAPGRYRLERTDSPRYFDVLHGPDSLKRFVFTPREPLLVIERKGRKASVRTYGPAPEAVALLGVRACDLAGLQVQDRIFLQDAVADPYYQARRQSLLIIAVHCTRAASTCFCASMETGPRARRGFDLALLEQDEGFLVEYGSERGRALLDGLPASPAVPEQVAAGTEAIAQCARSQVRAIDRTVLPQALYAAHEHPRWDDVAARCLACTNCTMVCPTCFCHKVEEHASLDGRATERARVWDSCFTPDHGYIHGKNVRPTTKDRYRLWVTHKLASWIDQFGVSGCVGCGRCLTWCPTGIDLTEEVRVLTGLRSQSDIQS